MTKKIVYNCDRCGVEFEDYDREFRLSKSTYDCEDDTYFWRYIDLCPECEYELIKDYMMAHNTVEDVVDGIDISDTRE